MKTCPADRGHHRAAAVIVPRRVDTRTDSPEVMPSRTASRGCTSTNGPSSGSESRPAGLGPTGTARNRAVVRWIGCRHRRPAAPRCSTAWTSGRDVGWLNDEANSRSASPEHTPLVADPVVGDRGVVGWAVLGTPGRNSANTSSGWSRTAPVTRAGKRDRRSRRGPSTRLTAGVIAFCRRTDPALEVESSSGLLGPLRHRQHHVGDRCGLDITMSHTTSRSRASRRDVTWVALGALTHEDGFERPASPRGRRRCRARRGTRTPTGRGRAGSVGSNPQTARHVARGRRGRRCGGSRAAGRPSARARDRPGRCPGR